MNPLQIYKRNFSYARRHWRQSVIFGLFWATGLAIHAFASLYFSGWQNMASIANFAVLMWFAIFVGGMLGWSISTILSAHRILPKRFATGLVFILVMTMSLAAGGFALQFRLYYAQWHMDVFSTGGMFQLLFTFASATYLFAVQGLRTFLPFGPLALFGAALIFARLVSVDKSKEG